MCGCGPRGATELPDAGPLAAFGEVDHISDPAQRPVVFVLALPVELASMQPDRRRTDRTVPVAEQRRAELGPGDRRHVGCPERFAGGAFAVESAVRRVLRAGTGAARQRAAAKQTPYDVVRALAESTVPGGGD